MDSNEMEMKGMKGNEMEWNERAKRRRRRTRDGDVLASAHLVILCLCPLPSLSVCRCLCFVCCLFIDVVISLFHVQHGWPCVHRDYDSANRPDCSPTPFPR